MSKMSEIAIAIERISQIVRDFDYCSDDERSARLVEYNQIVPILLNYFGEDGSAYAIDPLMASVYSDFYFIANGHRPINPIYSDMEEFFSKEETLTEMVMMDDELDFAEAEEGRDVFGFSPFQCMSVLKQ